MSNEAAHRTNNARYEEFEKLVDPLIKWLNDQSNPHAHIIITSTEAELSHGVEICVTSQHLND